MTARTQWRAGRKRRQRLAKWLRKLAKPMSYTVSYAAMRILKQEGRLNCGDLQC